jgi:DNA-binding PadR family transcriptional regulator
MHGRPQVLVDDYSIQSNRDRAIVNRMPAEPRSNPLALAVLACLAERPMHPYEAATTLRDRRKHESVRLNYGSLYSVVASLERRGFVKPVETVREGRRPERTVYALTDAGRGELHDWLAQLIAAPAREYTGFEAALSFLPVLAPEAVAELLRARARQLEEDLAQRRGSRGLLGRKDVPRVFWVEEEYRTALRRAELKYVRGLASDLEDGSLDGLQWWAELHRGAPAAAARARGRPASPE